MIKRPSMAYCDMIKQVVESEQPDFATDELGMRNMKEFHEDNPIADVLAKLKIPYYAVDMDDFAQSYLSRGIKLKLERRNEVLEGLRVLSDEKITPDVQENIDRLVAYGQYLHDELEEEIRQVQFGIRESWMAMGILKQADRFKKKRITAIHLSSPRHFQGLMDLLQSLDVEVTPISFKQILSETPREEIKGMTELTGVSSISVVPVIKRPKAKLSDILFFLEADDHASPFDICVAYDAGFNVVVPYVGVAIDRIHDLVQDAIFSRGTKGVKHTCFFVGGRQVPIARQMAETIQKAMVKPFETSIVVDPHGAFSTSAAMVAKAEAALHQLDLGSLKGKIALVLAGTGPVGESVAHLLSKCGAITLLTSRKIERAKAVAHRASTKENTIEGVQAITPDDIQELLEDVTLIFTVGAPGVQLVSLAQLQAVLGPKILVDVNAVPPSGVESLNPMDDLRELIPDTFGIGALAIGDLKLKVQRQILQVARKKGQGIFDDRVALDIAREILEEQLESASRPRLKIVVAAQ
ncbi:MAG: methylenetetrahydromethanopterin dehydrogenase [Candidatus Hermodarchaeota archaeon]|nr:methylenetetrahydromethanopterin dehydrogenase [Candidatus Hermodarchaeota archaeon]